MKFWYEVDGLLLRQASPLADEIRSTFIRTVPVDDIVNRWADSFTGREAVTNEEARRWLQANANIPQKPLEDVLDHVYAMGWVIGQDASAYAYASARMKVDKAAPTESQMRAAINADWSNWKPGNRPASQLVSPTGSFKKLLDRSETVIKEVNSTTLNRIGTLLGESLTTGQSYDSLARKLLRDDITASVIKDASRAQTIAVTEMSRALNASTLDNYDKFGVEMVEWLAIDTGVCEICPANEAQGPIKLGDVFDSGDEAPPAHPNCRCTVLPVVDEGAPITPEELEEALTPSEMEVSDVADHAIEDIAAAPAEPGVEDLPKLEDLFTKETNAEILDGFKGVYEGQDFNGFKLRVDDAEHIVGKPRNKAIDVRGRILNADGEKVGQFKRSFFIKPDGSVIADHELLTLDYEYRGKGFSTEFSKFSEAYYRANGVKAIEVYASLENGGYTWAKAGYEFSSHPLGVIQQVQDKARRLRAAALEDSGKLRNKFYNGISADETNQLADRLDALAERMETGSYNKPDYIKPFEISNMEGPEFGGKSFGRWLLDGTSWMGEKLL